MKKHNQRGQKPTENAGYGKSSGPRHGAHPAQQRDGGKNQSRKPVSGKNDNWLWGIHPVLAALANPDRKIMRLVLTTEAANRLKDEIPEAMQEGDHKVSAERAQRRDIDQLLPAGAVHQGIAIETAHTPDLALHEILDHLPADEPAIIVALDQPNDPHNIGAVIRSAAAFGATAVIVPDRGTPEVTGVLAKSASGALERIALIRITNMARTLQELKNANFWCVGLDTQGSQTLAQAQLKGRIAVILGAEGAGLRRLTRENCDELVKVPMTNAVESLNLSNAAAITLYELSRDREI